MDLGTPARRVATVAGTNGKGSTVAFIEAIARAAGLRVGAYTSPHLLAYNERVRIDGRDANDDALIDAFEAVEAARGTTPLTYFEYGTLAALWLFERTISTVAILEVASAATRRRQHRRSDVADYHRRSRPSDWLGGTASGSVPRRPAIARA